MIRPALGLLILATGAVAQPVDAPRPGGVAILDVGALDQPVPAVEFQGKPVLDFSACFFIASLSIIGVPPGGGTWSKWYLLVGTLETQQWIVMLVLLVSSLLNIAYLLPIPVRAFMSAGQDSSVRIAIKEAPLASLIALCITAVGSVILFVYPQPLYELASQILAYPEIIHAQ